jgi:hypothetical protein
MSADEFGMFHSESVGETKAAIAEACPDLDFGKLVSLMVEIDKLPRVTVLHEHECCREFSVLYEQLRTALGDKLNRYKFMSLPGKLGLSMNRNFNNISVFCHD